MSVSVSRSITIIPWRSGEEGDPSLPAYRWRVTELLSGDVSGGVIFVDAILEAALKATSRLWTIEEVMGQKNNATADQFSIQLTQADPPSPDQISFRRITSMVVAADMSFSALPLDKQSPPFGPFQHERGADMVLTLLIDSNTSGDVYSFMAWGWIWESEAFFSPTGPRKPW